MIEYSDKKYRVQRVAIPYLPDAIIRRQYYEAYS